MCVLLDVQGWMFQVRAPQGTEPKIRAFDADHERRRKSQLIKLFNRTTEQVRYNPLVCFTLNYIITVL